MIPRRTILEALTREALLEIATGLEITGLSGQRKEGIVEELAATRAITTAELLELTIPYEFQGVSHAYEPDFLVRLTNGVTVVLEVKGYEDEEDRAKHTAAKRWVSAVNNWAELGPWHSHIFSKKSPVLLSEPGYRSG